MEQPYTPQPFSAQEVTPAMASAFLNKVYLWMAACLLTTAGVAAYTTVNPEPAFWTVSHPWLSFLGCFGIVLVMQFGAHAFTSMALGGLLLAFAGLQGLIFGPLLYAFTQESLGLTFAVTAGMFGAMSVYGYVAKRDLSAWGRGLFMALIGLIIAGIANVFWGNGTADLVMSAIGVVVFALFTAYDTQMLLRQGLYEADEVTRSKGAVLGALQLYLDFINLFLYLLRFFGNRD